MFYPASSGAAMSVSNWAGIDGDVVTITQHKTNTVELQFTPALGKKWVPLSTNSMLPGNGLIYAIDIASSKGFLRTAVLTNAPVGQ